VGGLVGCLGGRGSSAGGTQTANKPDAGVGGQLVGIWWGLAGATWWGELVAVLLPWMKQSQRPVRAFKANTNRTDLMERHIGESRKRAPQRGTAARTAGSEENYCVIALGGRKSAASACTKTQIRSQQRTWDSRSSCPSATSVRRWLSPLGTSGLQKSKRTVSKQPHTQDGWRYTLTTNDSLIES
jgi:hypothetical protein